MAICPKCGIDAVNGGVCSYCPQHEADLKREQAEQARIEGLAADISAAAADEKVSRKKKTE